MRIPKKGDAPASVPTVVERLPERESEVSKASISTKPEPEDPTPKMGGSDDSDEDGSSSDDDLPISMAYKA